MKKFLLLLGFFLLQMQIVLASDIVFDKTQSQIMSVQGTLQNELTQEQEIIKVHTNNNEKIAEVGAISHNCSMKKAYNCTGLVQLIQESIKDENGGIEKNLRSIHPFIFMVIVGLLWPYFLFICIVSVLFTMNYYLKGNQKYRKGLKYSFLFLFLTLITALINYTFTVLLV